MTSYHMHLIPPQYRSPLFFSGPLPHFHTTPPNGGEVFFLTRTRRRRVQIHSLDYAPLHLRRANQSIEELGRPVALRLDLDGFFTAAI